MVREDDGCEREVGGGEERARLLDDDDGFFERQSSRPASDLLGSWNALSLYARPENDDFTPRRERGGGEKQSGARWDAGE